MNRLFLSAIAFLGLFVAVNVADASILDLTFVDATGSFGDATFTQRDPSGSTGTGVIDSFVQIFGEKEKGKPSAGDTTTPDAYNTTENNVLDNGAANNFNHSITLDMIPIVDLEGVLFREFLLDINEVNSGGDQYISLDDVQIFVGGTANSNVDSFVNGELSHDGTLVYRMDDTDLNDVLEDNTVALNYDLNSGSGDGDMFMYVLDSLFSALGDSTIITLYSSFGGLGVYAGGDNLPPAGNYGGSDGFEEWAIQRPEGVDSPGPDIIPEPSTWLIFSGLAACFGVNAWQKKKRTT